MSWSINVVGTGDEIAVAFDTERDRSAANGMIEAEQRDIDEARDFAVQLASTYGKLWIQANGHWSTVHPNPAKFGRLSITVSEAPGI